MSAPTPRTDILANLFTTDGTWIAHSRTLERELDAIKTILNEETNRAEKAEAECLEQAKLLGISGEREADLLGKLKRMENKK